jgi:hypothetical protein
MMRTAEKAFVAALIVLAATLFQAQLGAQVSPLTCRAAIAGRYSLTLGGWSRPLGADAPYHAIPTEILLDTAAAARGGWKVSPDVKYPHPHYFPGTPRWTTVHDTVQIVWSNGFQPTVLSLTRKDSNELNGEAVVGSDTNEYGTDPPRAQVTARRVACAQQR